MNKIQLFLLKIIKFMKVSFDTIINTDIDWIFIVMLTYMFNQNYPLFYRIVGAIGIGYVYKMIERTIIRTMTMKRQK